MDFPEDQGEVGGCFQGHEVAAAGDDVQVCAGQVGQQVVAEHLDRLDVVVFAGDDEDGNLDVPGVAGNVLGDPVQRRRPRQPYPSVRFDRRCPEHREADDPVGDVEREQ
jgi:hypothetical protein